MLVLFVTHCLALAMFRTAGAVGTRDVTAVTGGAFVFLLVLLLGGFIVAKGARLVSSTLALTKTENPKICEGFYRIGILV